DYKSAGPSPRAKTRRKTAKLTWFVAGLGLPLVLLLIVLWLRDPPEADAASATDIGLTPISLASTAGPPSLVEALTAIQLPDAEPLPSLEPVPQYDSLALEVRSGDTLDRLFRKHDLNLADLAAIVKLPEAHDYLRLLKPGDELMIEHDGARLVSLYREVDLTRALRVTRTESGYAAEILERPLEEQKRLSYGRIDSSLFESAAAAGLPDKLIMAL